MVKLRSEVNVKLDVEVEAEEPSSPGVRKDFLKRKSVKIPIKNKLAIT